MTGAEAPDDAGRPAGAAGNACAANELDLAEINAEELERHMAIEEQVLFPSRRRLESDGESGFRSLSVPIDTREADHAGTGDALARLSSLTDGYSPPSDACNSYRALYAGLEELEQDLHLHIHEESNVLFPRALELEARAQP